MKSLYNTRVIPSSTLVYASVVTLSLATLGLPLPSISWNTLEKVRQAFIAYFTPEFVFQHAAQTAGTGNMPTKSQGMLHVTPTTPDLPQAESQALFKDIPARQGLQSSSPVMEKAGVKTSHPLDLPGNSSADLFKTLDPTTLSLFQKTQGNAPISLSQGTSFPGWGEPQEIERTSSQQTPTASDPFNSEPQEVLMRPWHTYNIQGHLARVQNWIKVLAPETPVDIHEVPYREALIKTILSPQFKYRIASTFWTSQENAQERGIFLRAYVDDIDWSRTSYPNGLMGSPGVDGACHLNEAALDEALRLPQRHKILQDCDDCWGL